MLDFSGREHPPHLLASQHSVAVQMAEKNELQWIMTLALVLVGWSEPVADETLKVFLGCIDVELRCCLLHHRTARHHHDARVRREIFDKRGEELVFHLHTSRKMRRGGDANGKTGQDAARSTLETTSQQRG